MYYTRAGMVRIYLRQNLIRDWIVKNVSSVPRPSLGRRIRRPYIITRQFDSERLTAIRSISSRRGRETDAFLK